MNSKPRIIFMGTPLFAVASLAKLLEEDFNIVGVITAPDKPSGRGLQMNFSAVKNFALAHQLPIFQPTNLKNIDFLQSIQNLKPDLQVVVAFRMLPDVLCNIPILGTINLHASLLPQYRGAAPINWAIINGETITGVTIIRISSKIDCGNILNQMAIPILPEYDAGILHDILMTKGAALLADTIVRIINEDINEICQSAVQQENIKSAPKLTIDNCKINFSKTVQEVQNFIKGLSPYPGAYTFLGGKLLKIFKCQIEEITPVQDIQTDKKSYIKKACKNGYIVIEELQIEGKKRMLVADFLKGYHWTT